MFEAKTMHVFVSPLVFRPLGAYCGAPKGKEQAFYGIPGFVPGGTVPGEDCVRRKGKVRAPKSSIMAPNIGACHEKCVSLQVYKGASARFHKLFAGSAHKVQATATNKILS